MRIMMRKKTLLVALLLMLFAVQSLVFISTKSATFDEVQYFGIGKYLLKEHRWDVMGAILHPPLSYYLNSLPLLFVEEDKRLWQYGVKERNLDFLGSVDYYRGQELLSMPENRGDRLLIASRCMTLLTALLLGLYVYRFGAEIFGERSALLSLFLFAFCPNMLAYSGIAVPDMPVTAFSFISVYYFWKVLCNDGNDWILTAGIFLGLALLSKFTAMVLLPVFFVLTAAYAYERKKNKFTAPAAVMGIGLLILWAGYMFDLTPFLLGNQYRLEQQGYGQATFAWGNYSNHGWWYFYPAALLLKTPLPLIMLVVAAIVLMFRGKTCSRFDRLLLLLPPVAFLLFFSLSGYAVGIRYVLPVYPFLFVAAGSVASCAGRSRILLALAALWYLGSSLYVAPHYLAYFNEAAGGPANGYKLLVDSNLDWGQDLKGLKRYMDKNGIEKVSLSYFGADSPGRYGIKYDWLPSFYLFNNEPGKPPVIDPNQLVAISVTNLQGVYFDNHEQYKWLMKYRPIAKIGYSIFVYDLKGKREKSPVPGNRN